MAFRFGRKRAAVERDELADEVDTVERVAGQYAPGTRLNFGAPTRCPRCADYGLIEHVDVVAGRADNRCLRCGTRWTLSVRALLAVDRTAPRRSRARPGRAAAHRSAKAELQPTKDQPGIRFSRTPEGGVTRSAIQDPTRPFVNTEELDALVIASYRPLGRVGPMRVLLVEDNPDDVEIVKAILESAGPDVIDLRTATTRTAGEVAARTNFPDLVLLDLGLPDSRGLDTVTEWNEHVPHLPLLVVSGALDRSGDRGLGGHGDVELGELGVAGVVDKAELVSFLEQGDAGTHAFIDRMTSAAAVG